MGAGPLMVDVAGLELTAIEIEMLRHPSVSGVILFARNYASPQQLLDLVSALRALRQPRLLIAVDQEGGRVQRFREGFYPLPALRHLGNLYEKSPVNALITARELGWLMATEILSVGIDLSFAPVLDLDRGISDVIGSRAFATTPAAVTALAGAYIEGMHQAGMAATGKHFPGHGSVKADSHYALPIDERVYSVIYEQDMQPFCQLCAAGMDAVMVSHVIYPDVDAAPAGFSKVWVDDILKTRLGFQGMVFSDDITMQAAASIGSHTQRAQQALAAGCDCVVTCNDHAGRDEIIANLQFKPSDNLQAKIAKMYGRSAADFAHRQSLARWQTAHATIQRNC